MTSPTIPPVTDRHQVVVTDIQMPFWSMVTFMVKWSFAAIPAMIILFLVTFFLAALFSIFVGGWRHNAF